MKRVEGVLCLLEEFVPQLGWEVPVCGAEPGDKMILEGLDGTFGGVDSVFVGWNELPFDVLSAEVFGDGVGSFVVQDIELWLESF